MVPKGPDGEPLVGSFANRDNPVGTNQIKTLESPAFTYIDVHSQKYLTSLGRSVARLCHGVPHGAIVFFSSYGMLDKCSNSWKEAGGVWDELRRAKEAVFVEPRDKVRTVRLRKCICASFVLFVYCVIFSGGL